MSLGKHMSVTSDTRATGSFQHSLGGGHPKIAKQLMQSQQCEVQFLRRKNSQLQQRVGRMTQTIDELQNNKIELLALNQKYVRVMNEYYRKMAPTGKENRNNGNSVLSELEKDHRNLVKHCLAMEIQIKNYTKEMEKFNQMKGHLHSVNHSNTKQLIEELKNLSQENKGLKMDNNRLQFQLQKSKQECNRLKKGKEDWQDKADLEGGELETYKSLINTIQQEATDKSNNYQAKIYQLEIKVQKLQKQLREGQQFWFRTKDVKRKLQIAQVQHVHQKDYFRMSLRDKKSNSRIKNSVSFCQ